MQNTRKNSNSKVRTKKSTQEDLARSTEKEDKLKKNVYSVSTPRSFVQKSSTADIYANKKLAPKKVPSTSRIKSESPMKDLLKPSQSSTSLMSRRIKADIQKSNPPISSSATKSTPRRPALSNVTVNSPVAKRRLNLEVEGESSRRNGSEKKELTSATNKPHSTKDQPTRQRTKTRTLEEDEVKILTPEAIDNNAAMQDLSRKLSARPKAFYVELEKPRESKMDVVRNQKQEDKSSEDEEVSYEDDFESYESEFESYHSGDSSGGSDSSPSGANGDDEEYLEKTDNEEAASKEVKDEERMLDSGNYDLRDPQRSASRKPGMDFILEGSEDPTDDKKTSLTDEGFQEMSSSSAVSSMRMVHTEVLDRPLFIDFTKSKENKRKRKIFERLKQRAKDILSMVTLHEISYSLFEMKPIPYDLYMATFGRKNYTQTAVQTFDDGVTEEIQTDDILCDIKWTQFPVEFSNSCIVHSKSVVQKDEFQNGDFVRKFNYLIKEAKTRSDVSDEYRTNPLKIFLEQKDGAGSDVMLSEEVYKSKLKDMYFNVAKLRNFLKKSEGRISSILSLNAGSQGTLNLVRNLKVPFSEGYLSVQPKNITDDKLNYLKYTEITGVAISETKDNLIMTYHKKCSNSDASIKSVICLWDTSVARCEPLKVLKATDKVMIGRYRGNTNGIFVAALEDGTLHLWDLSEEPTWCDDVASIDDEKPTELVEIDSSRVTQTESDREWNLRNMHVTYVKKSQTTLQVSAYTSSAVNMYSNDSVDCIVGMELVGDAKESSRSQLESGVQKVIGQICTLQRLGILIIWFITQDKPVSKHDIGKAFWSKLKLEKHQTVHLSEHVDAPISNLNNNFNLNAAKRRLSSRKQERIERRKEISRPKSVILRNTDRSNSIASPRKNLPFSRNVNDWDYGIICNHLKVLRMNKIDNYLVATSYGDVLCCKRFMKDFKVDRLHVAADNASITQLEVAYNNLPYYLAATDSGTVNLCSVVDARVLLTLDCRNGPPVTTERCHADSKGRFIASVPVQTTEDSFARFSSQLSIKRLAWLSTNPFTILALTSTGKLVTWELTRSDIYAMSVLENAAVETASSRLNSLALVTLEGEVQLHRLLSEKDDQTIDLFKKYVALL